MAKKDKAAKADTKGKNKDKGADKSEKAAEREFKFGVEDLADRMDLKPASVRVKLRNASIEKAGKSYGWNSEKELKDVMAEIKSEDSEKPAKSKKDDAKPAKGKKGKGKKDKSDD